MAKAPETPALGDLRKEIDRIDESMHQLLMERGEIIDRLIAVKKSQETGSAFRPVREAEYEALGDLTVAAYRAIRDAPREALEGYENELRDVARRVEAGAEVVVAMSDDGVLAGGVTYVPDHVNDLAEFDDPDAAGIRMLAVSPDHQGGGAGSTLTAWCEQHGIAYQGVPVGTIKRHITGKGNADKAAIIAAVRGRGFAPADDNEADAIAILLWAIETQGGVR